MTDGEKSLFTVLSVQNDEVKSKHSNSTVYRQNFHSTLTQVEADPSRTNNRKPSQSPVNHRPTPARLPIPNGKGVGSAKKKPSTNDRYRSASNSSRPLDSDSSTLVQSVLGRYRSAVPRYHDSSFTIQEAKGPTSRYNQPEELFGLRPAELFGTDEHQPKILDPRSNQHRAKRPPNHLWQQDLDQVLNLYNVHQSPNYRRSAHPPHSTISSQVAANDTSVDSGQNGRHRRGSITKTPAANHSKMSLQSRPSIVPPTNFPRRNSISRPATKIAQPS